MAGSFIAMDAEQKRDADGKFGSGGGAAKKSDHEKHGPSASTKKGDRVVQEWDGKRWSNVDPKSAPKGERITQEWDGNAWNDVAKDASPFQPDETASMQGEAGRLARKQARDCMSGRFRP